MNIAGKRVLLTGATRGIGRALAERFVAERASLALVARSAVSLAELAGALGAKPFPADLGDARQVDGLIERVEADGGAIDILVNNAGISNVDHALNQSAESIEAVVRVNLLTPIHLCQQVIPRMLARGGGHIVNMGSIAGFMPPPGLVHYGASKAGLAQYTAGLRVDLRGMPIGLTTGQIGSTASDMDDATQNYAPYRRLRGKRSVEDVRIPLAKVIDAIIDGIVHERRNVVLPAAMRPLAGLVEVPRRVLELIFRNVDLRPT
jgi:short-subunit dehydrogenase